MTPIDFQTNLDAQDRTIGSDVNRNGMPKVTDAIVPTRVDPLATTVKIMRGKDKLEPAPPTPPEEPIAIAPLQEPIAIASPSKKLDAAAATEAAKEMLDIRRGAVYQSALRSSGEDADAAAKTLKAARDSGTSYDFTLENMKQTQRRLYGRDVAKLDLPITAPALAQKLTNDPDFARVANDDLANLKEQEGWFSWFGHQVTGIPTAFMHGFAGYEHAESGAMQVFGPSPLHPTMWSMADPQTFENRNAQLNAQELTFDPENEGGWLPVFNMLGQTAYQFARAVPAAGGGAIVGGLTGGLAGVSPLPWQKAATPVTTLVGAQLGAKAGLSAALIEDQVRQAAGMMYNRMIDEGVDPNVARWKAASWGLALGGIQVGLMKVLYPKIATSILETQASKAAADKLLAKKLAAAIADPSMKGVVKRISAQTAKTTAKTLGSVGGMVIMFEAANEDARRASNLPMRSASPEGRAELIDIAVNNFKFMATGAVGMHVLMPSAHNPIMELGRERSRIRAAEKQAEGFETLSILQKASKLAVRSPEDAQSLMEGTLTGTPIEDILISKEGIQRAMATLKIPMAKLDEVIPGALAQFNDVASGTAESGGYIKVKTADFKARIEKTPLGSLLLGDVTWSAEIGTMRESAARSAFLKTFISEINENVEKFSDEVNEAINKDDANRESAEKVANVIEAQLIGEGRTAEQARTESRFLGAIAFAGAARESEGKATRMTPEEFHRKYPIHIAERESEKPSEPAREVAAPTETAAQVKPVVPTTVDPTSRPRTVAEMLVENRRAEEAKANEPVGQMSRQGNDAVVEAIANLREANETHKGFAKDEGSTAKTASMHEMMSDQIDAVEREVKAGDAVGLEIEIGILQAMLGASNIREARNAVKQAGIAKQLATTAQRLIDTTRGELDRIESTPKTGEEGALNQEPAVRKRDVEYKAAVERGDTETAQQMVNDAARNAGYTVGPVYHGTKQAFTTFKGSVRDSSDLSYFSFNKEFAERWPRGIGGLREPSPEIRARIDAARTASAELGKPLWAKLLEKYGAWDKMPDKELDAIRDQRHELEQSMLDGMTVAQADSDMGIRVINGFLRAENVFNPRENWREFIPQILKVFDKQSIEELTESEMQAVTEGNYLVWENREVVDAVLSRYDAIRLQESRVDGNLDTIAIRDPSRIKSSDPITRDEQGNVIPLSERFNPESDNFLYQPLTTMVPSTKNVVLDPTIVRNPSFEEAVKPDAKTRVALEKNVLLFDTKEFTSTKSDGTVVTERAYNSIKVEGNTAQERAESIIQQMVRNLLEIHDRIPEATRKRSKLWYMGANRISRVFAKRYDLTDRQSAAGLAVLSPQADWRMNISYWERILDISRHRQQYVWDAKMTSWADGYIESKTAEWEVERLALEKSRDNANKSVLVAGKAIEGKQKKYESVLAEVDAREQLRLAELQVFENQAAEVKAARERRDITEKAAKEQRQEIAEKKSKAREAVDKARDKDNNKAIKARQELRFAETEKRQAEREAIKRQAKVDEGNPNLLVQDFIRGMSLANVESDYARAWWIRAYDEAHNPRAFRDVTPEGDFLDFVKTDKRNNYPIGWKSFDGIAKAVSIIRDGSIENIHDQLGNEHKVRSFYNNIYAPNSLLAFLTSDTHQVAADLMEPLGSSAIEVSHNFGTGKGVGVVGPQGLKGTYWMHAEAVVRAARARGLIPREMQSITWEAVKGLFKDTFKQDEKNLESVRDLWDRYRNGEATYEETFESIVKLANGFTEPSWVGIGSDRFLPAERGHSSYENDLAHSGVTLDESALTGEERPRNIGDVAADVSKGESGVLEQAALASPEFFSALKRSVDAVDAKELTGAQWKDRIATLVNKGEVKEEEIYWTGFYDFLDMQREGKITKEELAAFLQNKGVDVRVLSSEEVRSVKKTYHLRSSAHGSFIGSFESIEKAEAGIERNFQLFLNSQEKSFDRYIKEYEGLWYVSKRETVTGEPSGLIFDSRESAEAYAKREKEYAIDIERQKYRTGFAIREVNLGGGGKDFESKYDYEPLILPNGENYREVLLTLPNFRPPVKPASAETFAARKAIFEKYETAIKKIDAELETGLRNSRDMTQQEMDALTSRRYDLRVERNLLENARDQEASDFPIPQEADALRWKIPHFGQTGQENNVLVSTRLNDRRVSEQSKPALHVEEIQSDQAAKGRDEGFEPKEGVQSSADFLSQEDILYQRLQESTRAGLRVLAQLHNLGFDVGDRSGPFEWLRREPNWDFENRFPELTPLTEAQMNDLRQYVKDRNELIYLRNSRKKSKLLVPRAPFITSTDGYVNLALKHTLMEAVKGNYKYVTFITGEQSVQRYKDALLKVIDNVQINRNEDGTYTYVATKNGRDVRSDSNVSSKEVAETFGKEGGKELVRVADAADVNTVVNVNAVDMPVGGAGMRKFYDSMVIDLANKMSKRLGGGKIESLTMSDGTVQPALEITDAMAAKINEAGGLPLFQAASKKPARASFNPKTFEVKLGHHSDMTSWVHESSHYLFETYHRMILDGSAPKWVADDFQTLLTFFGVKDNAEWNTLSFEARRKHYEKFSYNFEIYMAEGKAPTIALQPLFDRFKSWIIQVYTDVVKHQNTLYKEQFGEELPPLTDEVRRVMDRMLATEEQIRSTAEARDMKAMFQTQEEAGVSDAAWAEYQTVLGASHRDAVNELTARSMRDFQWVGNMKSKFLKELAKKNAATRRAVRDEVEEQVRAEPIFRAIDFLKYGMTTSENGERVLAENVGKLNLADAKAVLGDEAAKLGYGKYGMIAKDGMPADLVAELFGFKSGEELLRALAAAKKVGDEIDARTDERMMKEFGDLNDPERMEQAANAALHNDARARAVATELNFITKATTPVKEMVAAAREAAVDHINNRKIKDVKAHEFAVAEAKAARAARSTADSKVNPEAIGKSAGTRAYNKAIANGVDEAAAVKLGEDAATTAAANAQERINLHKKQYGDVDPMESARRAKQHQLFNNQLAAVAGEVQEEVRDTVRGFSKFFKADSKIGKSRDIEMVMAARSILSAFGFGRSDKAPIDYVKQIEAFNPELFAGLEPIIARVSRGAQDYRELTVAEFRALSDGVTALWNDARRDKQIMVGDKKVALAQVVGELVDRTTELGVPTEMAGDKSAPTQRQRMMRTLNGVKNMMRRVEHWCDAMDGLDNTGGPFTKYIFRPIVDAMDAYRADRTKYLKRYAELCATIELPKGRIAAPELDYTFGVGNGGIGKSELLGALLHMGNDSNMRKLLIGRKWGELDAEGNLDASRMMKFINRMVTEGKLVKADFDFVQSVWDLNEELKPMSQKSHRDLYGFYFKEVEATPLNTPFGTYRGGYVPAKADPFMVKDAQRHAKMDALEGNFNQVMPSTGLGFTQPRVEYNRPLALDLRMIGKHIDDVIRFAHVQPAIKDVLKVIGNEEFASALSKIDPTAIETMLIPFLGRAARHTAVEQGRFKAVDDFWIAVRGRTSLMFMSLNLRQLGDVGGISVALTKVKRGQLAAAMKQYLDSPHEVATMIAEASPMMDERLSNHINDTRARLDDLIGDQSGLGKAQALARKHGMFLNTVLHNQLDIVTWLGAYNQALAEIAASAGDKEAQREAVSRADAAVRLTQGAMNPEDVAAYEQGTPFYRTITQFTTYLNTLANLNADEYGKIVRELGIRKGAGKLVKAHILAYAVPMIIFGAWTDLISGGWNDDDESWYAHALGVLFGSYFSGGVGMLPFGSQVQGIAEATIAKSIGGSVIRNKEHINVSPSINALEGGVVGAADTAYRAVSGKEITGKNIKDALTLVSLFTGIPLNPIGKTVGYAVDVNNNKIQPTGTADYIRGLITGSASPESRK